MNIANKSVLITGTNRGIGKALVEEALRRGAKKVYAAARGPQPTSDKRVTPLILDVTNEAQIQAAVEEIKTLDILINNAGIALYDNLSDPQVLEKHFAVNLFGPLRMIQTFLPLLKLSHGAVVNNLSIVGLAALPIVPSYSVSKAALTNLTQSMRALLAAKGVTVHGVFLGPVDTDMNRGFDIPKATTQAAAEGIFDGLQKGEEDIFPDPVSQTIAEAWRSGAIKAMERQFAGFAGEPVKA